MPATCGYHPLMGKPGTLTVLVILVAALGALAWFFLDTGGRKAPAGPAPALPADAPPPVTAALGGDPAPRGNAADAHGGRVAVALPDAVDGMPESYRESLAGFRGRVLHHDATPAADHRVALYRFDLQSIVNPDVNLFSERLFEPDVNAGDARTDAEGRFEIRGVFPRGFFLVQAGIGSDNATAKIVQRSPAPAEMVDLGDIMLKDGAILTGQVVDGDGKPIAGALVRATDIPGQVLSFVPLERFDPQGAIIVGDNGQTMVFEMPPWAKQRFDQLPIAKAFTGDDGRFRLAGVDAGENAFLVTAAERASHVNPRIKLVAGEERDLGRIQLDAGEEVYGRVVDDQGKPIAGADVLIGQGSALAPVLLASHHGPTDAKGAFEAAGFKSGKIVGAARRSLRDPWVLTEPQPVARDLVIKLPSRHALTLHLTSSAGLPIDKPDLRLLPGRGDQGAADMALWGVRRHVSLEQRVTQVDESRVRIADLDRGHYTLLARARGHATAVVTIELNGDIEHAVTLQAQKTFDVMVTDARNAPIADAAIYVQARGSHPRVPNMPLHCGFTDRKGRLHVDQCASDELSISAAHPKYGRAHHSFTLPQREVKLRFDDPGSLEGLLTDNGAVPELGKWTILLEPREQRAALPQLPRFSAPDARGEFRASGLEPGEYVVIPTKSLDAIASPGALVQAMYKAGFGSQNETRVQIAANTVARVTLDVVKPPAVVEGPAAHISGTVTINGRPGRGLTITGWGNDRLVATVADNGTFDLGQVKAGHVHVELIDPESPGFGRRRLWSKNWNVKGDENVVLDIALDLGSLSGTVQLVDGSPAAGVEVNANATLPERGARDPHAPQASANFEQVTDEQGRFEFADVPAGDYGVSVTDKRGHARTGNIEVVAGSARRGVELRLQKVFTARGSVDLTALAKEPFEWAWMQLHQTPADNAHHSWVGVEKSGRFEAEALLPGRYAVELQFMVRKPGEENHYDHRQFIADPIEIVDRDLEGLVIQPRPKPPPEPKKKKR